MSFIKHKIPFKKTGQFSSLFLDYLSGNEKLKHFYSFEPSIAGFHAAIKDIGARSFDRESLVAVLFSQYKKAGISSASIGLLRDRQTFTVCTGHQLCLFTGPLYFIYKIVTTINLAAALKKEFPEFNFVPVYWMASEDHDFDEIRSVNLFGKSLIWDHESGGAVGRMDTAGLDTVLLQLKQIMGISEDADALFKLFESAYSGNNLAEATRLIVHKLFGHKGLVIIDPDNEDLKKKFMQVMMDDITHQSNYPVVKEAASLLEKAGYSAQVNPREINVFRLENNKRTRIEEAGEEILSLSPSEYSPNVVLRPLYQQTVLPNLAYVGGPGEIAYWLEYRQMFEMQKVMFPVLMPRNFALITDERTSMQMEKAGVSFEEIFGDEDALIRRIVEKNTGDSISLDEEHADLRKLFEGISVKAAAADPTLKGAAEAELQKAIAGLKNIQSKMLRAEKQRQETTLNQVRKIRERFLPGGNLQERYENFIPYYLKNRDFINILLKDLDPFEKEMLVIQL